MLVLVQEQVTTDQSENLMVIDEGNKLQLSLTTSANAVIEPQIQLKDQIAALLRNEKKSVVLTSDLVINKKVHNQNNFQIKI